MQNLYVPSNICEDSAIARTTHLSIAAHQDDIEIMAYNGIMECFNNDKKWFSGIVVTNGDGSSRGSKYSQLSADEFVEIRNQEQRKAAVIGDYSFVSFLEHKSINLLNSPSKSNIIIELEQILLLAKPDIIYCHNILDRHETHVAVALCTIEALRNIRDFYKPKKLYGCEVWRSLDWLIDDKKVVMNASKYENLAQSLIGVFDSQIQDNKRYDIATIGRRQANATFHKSHDGDQQTASILGMDLLPLIENPKLRIRDFAKNLIEEFSKESLDKIHRLDII